VYSRGPEGLNVMTAIQDLYPADFAHCFGCGRLNAHGHHVRTMWTGTEGTALFEPKAEHIAIPGYVYGGLIASVIDCHGIGTAAAAAMAAAGATPGVGPSPRYVTASLEVQYLKPTPLGPMLELRSTPTTVTERKVIVEVSLCVGGVETVRGRVVAVPIPASMIQTAR
jgi:acyl-coenzyme A thioesterase PaaI-like protein